MLQKKLFLKIEVRFFFKKKKNNLNYFFFYHLSNLIFLKNKNWEKNYINYFSYLIKVITFSIKIIKLTKQNLFYCDNFIINLNKSQYYFTLNNNKFNCLWTFSTGIFLKKNLLKNKKSLKKKKNFNLNFFKKIFDLIKKKNILLTSNILILRGVCFKFIQFFLFLQKISLIKVFNLLILQSKLSYTTVKIKKIKAIKRKLLKRLIKLKN